MELTSYLLNEDNLYWQQGKTNVPNIKNGVQIFNKVEGASESKRILCIAKELSRDAEKRGNRMKANIDTFRTTIQKFCSTFLCATLVNLIASIPTTAEESTKGKITFGMGLFSVAASISLESIKTEQTQPDLAVSRSDVSFDRTVVWGVDNIYPYLNKCDATRTSYAEWYFTLNSTTGGRPGDRILSIPLCKESLGPDYERKIAQLREFMVSKDEYQKPPFHP